MRKKFSTLIFLNKNPRKFPAFLVLLNDFPILLSSHPPFIDYFLLIPIQKRDQVPFSRFNKEIFILLTKT